MQIAIIYFHLSQVPNIFPGDERATIQEAVRDKAKRNGIELHTPVDCWRYFVNRCKENLHIIFCMSPVGQAFKDRIRQFPSLVNCTTIDWFQVKRTHFIGSRFSIFCLFQLYFFSKAYLAFDVLCFIYVSLYELHDILVTNKRLDVQNYSDITGYIVN